VQATVEAVTPNLEPSVGLRPGASPGTVFMIGIWFGLIAGVLEGVGLLFFQKLDWLAWGEIVHVSFPILWISPLVDWVLFLVVALALTLAFMLWPRFPAFRVAVLVLTALTLYDWLLIIRRLHHPACFLLAVGVAVVLSRWAGDRELAVAQFCRRTLPALAAIVVIILIWERGGSWSRERTEMANLHPATPGSPNILVIAIDTLRADHVSAYGYSRPTTPNIDHVAKQGVLFENAVSASSWTFPSHVSLLSGEYPFENGLGKLPNLPFWGSTKLIRDPMIGEALRRAGYRTAAFSGNRAYFVNNLGFGRGFSHFADYYFSPADTLSRTVFGREFERWILSRGLVLRMLAWFGVEFDPDAEGTTARWKKHILDAHPPRKRGEEVNREALQWIGGAPQSHPFFAFLNYFDAHAPYGGPPSHPQRWNQDKQIDQYDNGVNYVDDCVGQLMAELARRHLDQSTVVVITADHGEMFGERGLYFHGKSLYWDLIHVPLIFWYPGHIPAGVRVSSVVSASFLPATLSSWLPGDQPVPFPGHSLSDLWQGPEPGWASDPTLSELAFNSYEFNLKRFPEYPVPSDLEGPMKSIVAGRWHLITHKEFGNQLYDWSKDPHESLDLINTAQGREVAGLLRAQLLDVLAGRKAERSAVENATALDPDGEARSQFVRRITGVSHLDDYYHLRRNAGSVITLELQLANDNPASALESVLSVENAEGKILQTCRNPEDDHLPRPGISDPTPDAFDDICVLNNAGAKATSASHLDVQVPGGAGKTVDLYLRVTDWNGGLISANSSYTISASSLSATSTVETALSRQRSLNRATSGGD
jgi:arylsulfatase A-like enzyme